MFPTAGIRRNLWTIIVLVPFAAAALAVLLNGVPQLYRSGDGALLELGTRTTARLQTMTGPYSRFGFHHPGPAYFFARIPLYYLFGRSASADYLTTCLICFLCIAASARIMAGFSGNSGAAVFSMLVAVCMLALGPPIWLSDWNPFVILFPVVLTFLALAAAAAGSAAGLTVGAVAGSFAVQTHMGTFPAVASAFVFALAVILMDLRRIDDEDRPGAFRILLRRSILPAGIALLVMWLPVALSWLTPGGGSNPGRILAFMRSGPPAAGPAGALPVWVSAVTNIEGYFLPSRMLRLRGLLTGVHAVIVAARLVLLALCARATSGRPLMRFQGMLCRMALLLHPVTFLSVMMVRGEPHSYLFIWFASMTLVSWTGIVLTAVSLAGLRWRPAIRRWALPAALVLLVLLSTMNTLAVRREGGMADGDLLEYDDPAVLRMTEAVSGSLQGYRDVLLAVTPAVHELWPKMAGLLNALDREGFDVSPGEGYGFMTGLPPYLVSRTLVVTEPDHVDWAD
ncbi:MAG: hypothetical protein AVO35_11595 [Candidatus Aegiribacteria sp. MLS_C]|nr:MAG: hypothetical protein AVO35_11595 [Candidatus Aegiribacteria sp. MLS_C]